MLAYYLKLFYANHPDTRGEGLNLEGGMEVNTYIF